MIEYAFKARVGKYSSGKIELDPIQVSTGCMTFSKSSRLQRTMKLKNDDIVTIIIRR